MDYQELVYRALGVPPVITVHNADRAAARRLVVLAALDDDDVLVAESIVRNLVVALGEGGFDPLIEHFPDAREQRGRLEYRLLDGLRRPEAGDADIEQRAAAAAIEAVLAHVDAHRFEDVPSVDRGNATAAPEPGD